MIATSFAELLAQLGLDATTLESAHKNCIICSVYFLGRLCVLLPKIRISFLVAAQLLSSSWEQTLFEPAG